MQLKKHINFIIVSLLGLFSISCSIPFPYTRDDAPQRLKKVCKEEFGYDLQAWSVNDTLWVLAPIQELVEMPRIPGRWLVTDDSELKEVETFYYELYDLDITDSRNKFNIDINAEIKSGKRPPPPKKAGGALGSKIQEVYQHISGVINRVLLNTEDPHKFCCLVAFFEDEKTKDIQVSYFVFFVKDMIKFQMTRIPRSAYQKRQIAFNFLYPYHQEYTLAERIQPYNISPNEFTSLVTFQNIEKKFEEVNEDKTKIPPPLHVAKTQTQKFLDTYIGMHTFFTALITDSFYEKLDELIFEPQGEAVPDSPKSQDAQDGILTLTELKRVYFYLARAAAFIKDKDTDNARRLLLKGLEIIPDDPTTINTLGYTETMSTNYEKALSHYDEILKNYPKNAKAYEGKGYAYRGLKDHEEALSSFKKVKEIWPHYWQADYEIGREYFFLVNYKEALKAYHQALSGFDDEVNEEAENLKKIGKNPDMRMDWDGINKVKAEINAAIGSVYFTTKKYTLAAKYYKKALNLDSENATAKMNLSLIQQQEGNPEEAMATYKELLKEDPDSLPANLGMAYALKQAGQYNEALNYYEKALALNPDSADIYLELGICHGELGDYSESLDLFNKSLELDSKNPRMHYSRGKVYTDMMQLEKAEADFRKAIEIKDNYAEAYYGLGFTFYNSKEYEKAKKYFEKAKQLYIVQENMESARIMNEYLNQLP